MHCIWAPKTDAARKWTNEQILKFNFKSSFLMVVVGTPRLTAKGNAEEEEDVSANYMLYLGLLAFWPMIMA